MGIANSAQNAKHNCGRPERFPVAPRPTWSSREAIFGRCNDTYGRVSPMLIARDVEVRAGARLLLEHASFQVAAGDKIGMVGRNGAGKTTLTRILSGEVPTG